MYWDLLKVDLFRRQIRSNKHLVSFAAITVSLTHPGINFALVFLVCGGAYLSIRVDKGGVQRSNLTTPKESQPMISYMLVYHPKLLGPLISEL